MTTRIVLLVGTGIALTACVQSNPDPTACEAPAMEACEDLGGVCREPYDCGSGCEPGESAVDATCGSGFCCVPQEALCDGVCYEGGCPEGPFEQVDRLCTDGGCVCCRPTENAC